jgi:pentatricopeptide repeat protein
MSEKDVLPNATTFSFMINRYVATDNVELALQLLFDMNERGLVCELKTAQGIIALIARLGLPRLALDIATSFEEGSVRKLDADVWMNCLISSAGVLYVRINLPSSLV